MHQVPNPFNFQMVHQAPRRMNKFQSWIRGDTTVPTEINDPAEMFEMDSIAQTWNDFLKVSLDKRSKQGNRLFSSDFEFCGTGHSIARGETYEDHLDDFRHYLEECNHAQAIHTFVDFDSGFGGFAVKMLQDIREETKIPVFCLASQGPNTESNDITRKHVSVINTAYMYTNLQGCCDILSPIITSNWSPESFPHMTDVNTNYRMSAVVAAAFDSCTLSYRNRFTNNTLYNIIRQLKTRPGRSLFNLNVSLPFGHRFEKLDILNEMKMSLPAPHMHPRFMTSLCLPWSFEKQFWINPNNDELFGDYRPSALALSLRGVRLQSFEKNESESRIQRILTEYSMRSMCPNFHITQSSQDLPLPVCFPPMFKDVAEDGKLLVKGHTADDVMVEGEEDADESVSLPVSLTIMTQLESSKKMGCMIKPLEEQLRMSAFTLKHTLREHDLSDDEVEEMKSKLADLTDEYS
eukprot:TRINITY_DN5618_c0_g1_i2.p1 TRINITY_DN5618_c0_g1~~TRINITY_DN5618_c0_g1_i2.p1  ORF type:complete len:537 (-),score=133.76 TRINITY_DN5618_c0_g1_i2:997-2385(-)